jgi:hypothetical protein
LAMVSGPSGSYGALRTAEPRGRRRRNRPTSSEAVTVPWGGCVLPSTSSCPFVGRLGRLPKSPFV